jgi:hypothetical protein
MSSMQMSHCNCWPEMAPVRIQLVRQMKEM